MDTIIDLQRRIDQLDVERAAALAANKSEEYSQMTHERNKLFDERCAAFVAEQKRQNEEKKKVWEEAVKTPLPGPEWTRRKGTGEPMHRRCLDKWNSDIKSGTDLWRPCDNPNCFFHD